MRAESVRILVTGVAGFIGYHVASRLLQECENVSGLDNLNDYYEVGLKEDRLKQLVGRGGFEFFKADLIDAAALNNVFRKVRPNVVIHLAAQAGVRYSIDNPSAYVDSNLVGFVNLLEACRHNSIEHLIFASSSSVYGANASLPYRVEDAVDHPVSLYAATKKANEVIAHSYSHLYKLPITGLRFFTVYGPWGRPDMAYFKFTQSLLAGEPIKVFNHGKMQRDFTYIDDVVESVVRLVDVVPTSDLFEPPHHPGVSSAPFRLFNIGNHSPVELMEFISILERVVGRKAIKVSLPMQAGDVLATYADVTSLTEAVGFEPNTTLYEGLQKFFQWYSGYYQGKSK